MRICGDNTRGSWDEGWSRLLELSEVVAPGSPAQLNPLREGAKQAWTTRQGHFEPVLTNSLLADTLSVSVTGTGCALNCAHCGGHYLKAMTDIRELDDVCQENLPRSALVSGGCDQRGVVPLGEHVDRLKALGQTTRLNLHVGLVDEAQALQLAELSATVSFDFVVDEEAIRTVYGFAKTAADYQRSYTVLRRYFPVVPHITIGLNGGHPSGELRAIELLGKLGVDELVFIIFRPTRGTRFARRDPPAPELVLRSFLHARRLLPATPINLGCMRPNGRYRTMVDMMAVLAGLNKIVLTTPPARGLAEALGLQVASETECCAL